MFLFYISNFYISIKKQVKKSRHSRKGKKYSRVNKKSMRGGGYDSEKFIAYMNGQTDNEPMMRDIDSLMKQTQVHYYLVYNKDIKPNGVCKTYIEKETEKDTEEVRYLEIPNISDMMSEIHEINNHPIRPDTEYMAFMHSLESLQIFSFQMINEYKFVIIRVTNDYLNRVINNDDKQKSLAGKFKSSKDCTQRQFNWLKRLLQ